jgi:hypothetical protein
MGRNRPLVTGLCTLLFLSVLSISRSVEAGEDTFKIPDYIPQKFTDLRLQITGGANSSNNNSHGVEKRNLNSDEYALYGYGDNTHYRRYNLSLGSNGEYRYETVPFRLRCGTDLKTAFDFHKQEQDSYSRDEFYQRDVSSIEDQHSYLVSAKPFVSGSRYFGSKLFLSTAAEIGLYYSYLPSSGHREYYDARQAPDDSLFMVGSYSLADYSSRDYYFSSSVNISGAFGLGHLYEGWYAATSMYIINELRSISLLESEPTSQQMRDICALVYQNSLQHAIDNRIRLIESMQAILGYLEQQGILKQGFFSALILQDVWNFFPRTSRRFGSQVSIGCGVMSSYSRQHDSSFSRVARVLTRYPIENPEIIDTSSSEYNEGISRTENSRHSWLPYVIVQAELCKAIDLKWQFDANFSAKYYLNSYNRSTGSSFGPWSRQRVEYDDYFSLGGAGTLTYIANSRTSASLTGQMAYSGFKQTNLYWSPFENDGMELRSPKQPLNNQQHVVTLQVIYRLAIPTTLVVSLNYNYGQIPANSVYWSRESTDTNYSASVSISHYLF